jgi:hypothetical protein
MALDRISLHGLKYFVRALKPVREEGVNRDDLGGITTVHL